MIQELQQLTKSIPLFETIKPTPSSTIFKTKDAKNINEKVIRTITSSFIFPGTKNILPKLITKNKDIIKIRQHFFLSLPQLEQNFLPDIILSKQKWKVPYHFIIVTEDDSTYLRLKKQNFPIMQLSSSQELQSLEEYDLIYAVDIERFATPLDQMNHAITINEENINVERYLQLLSPWKEIILLLNENKEHFRNAGLSLNIEPLLDVLPLLSFSPSKIITKEDIDSSLLQINKNVQQHLSTITLKGDIFFSFMNGQKLPSEIDALIQQEIKSTNLPSTVFIKSLPITLDYEELNFLLKEQGREGILTFAKELQKKATSLKNIPKMLEELEQTLLAYDFLAGISQSKTRCSVTITDNFNITQSTNLFMRNPQPISFSLDQEHRCSILTGANSGGKTTLLEHFLQIVTLTELGLPLSAKEVEMPLFDEVYYFAKNKGSAGSGAFERLLKDLSSIKAKAKTLILADELEAVTEPGVAAQIIRTTCSYFAEKGCFIVLATHLGQEIVRSLPKYARVDGIEAKGLDEDMNLIVDHNPVLGRLAHSTPELIIEKLAKTKKELFFSRLYEELKEKKVIFSNPTLIL